jgi:predicted MFS family arabinose efflux permease
MTPLAWLFVLAGLISLDARIIAPVLPAIAASLGVTPGEAGLSMTAYTLSYGLMQVVFGPLSDRYGRVRVIHATALLFALGCLASALAPTMWTFVAARLATGVFAAAAIPTTFAHIGDTVPYTVRQRVVGQLAAVISAAQALSAALSGTVTHFVSWRLVFGVYAGLAVLPALALTGARERQRPAAPASRVRYADLLRLAPARAVYVAAFAEGFFIWGGTTYLGVLAHQRFGWNDLQVGLLVAVYGAGTIAGALALSWLAAALGERRLALGGGLLQAAGYLGLVPVLPWPVFALCLLALGLGLAGLHSTLQTRGTELLPAARGKAFSLFALGFFVGGAAGTAALGWMVDAGGIRPAMALCGLGLAIVGRYVAGGARAGAPR